MLARIAKLYEIEAEIRGQPPDIRQAVRQRRSRPLVEDLQRWLQEHLPRLPGWSDLAKAMRYALAHWDGLILYLDDGRLEMDTTYVERAIRPVTIEGPFCPYQPRMLKSITAGTRCMAARSGSCTPNGALAETLPSLRPNRA